MLRAGTARTSQWPILGVAAIHVPRLISRHHRRCCRRHRPSGVPELPTLQTPPPYKIQVHSFISSHMVRHRLQTCGTTVRKVFEFSCESTIDKISADSHSIGGPFSIVLSFIVLPTVNGDASSNGVGGVGSDSCATNANKAVASIRYYCKPNQEKVVNE